MPSAVPGPRAWGRRGREVGGAGGSFELDQDLAVALLVYPSFAWLRRPSSRVSIAASSASTCPLTSASAARGFAARDTIIAPSHSAPNSRWPRGLSDPETR